VLIDFWATWCGPCIQELPNVVAAYQQFHEQGFEVLGISLDRERERLDQFLARQNMPWPQIHDTPEAGAIANKYGVESIPATFLLGRDGKIARVGLRGEDLHDAVQLLLERKQ
jgi:peroxiredoxin